MSHHDEDQFFSANRELQKEYRTTLIICVAVIVVSIASLAHSIYSLIAWAAS